MAAPLTADEMDALRRYAAKHGRRWKSVLQEAWLGHPPYDDTGTLRTLRNTHGPSWLIKFKLPTPRKESTP